MASVPFQNIVFLHSHLRWRDHRCYNALAFVVEKIEHCALTFSAKKKNNKKC
jgi:hypothetical protein